MAVQSIVFIISLAAVDFYLHKWTPAPKRMRYEYKTAGNAEEY
jgi:hypothetical protein